MTFEELKFKAEDFEKTRCLFNRMSDYAWLGASSVLRDEANRILAEKLERAPEMACWQAKLPDGSGYVWRALSEESETASTYKATHKARLVCIEEVGK